MPPFALRRPPSAVRRPTSATRRPPRRQPSDDRREPDPWRGRFYQYELNGTRGPWSVVGINSQILSPSGVNSGIGFAIPANMAKNVMTQLIEHGEVRRGMLGVTVQPITSEIACELSLNQIRGALVASVDAGSPAERAGLKKSDVIVGINGSDVKDGNELRNAASQLLPGTNTAVVVVRDGREQRVAVRLAELRVNN